MDIQKQAEYLIKKFNLEKDLRKFGEPYLVGSVALRTMLKRDIDFQIYTKSKPTLQQAREVEKMFYGKGFDFVLIKELKEIGKILISVEYFPGGKRWTIDVTLTQKGKNLERDSVALLKELEKELDDKKRKAIIKLKKHFFEKGLLHNSMSYYIYRAVVDDNVKNEKEMLRYLSTHKLTTNQFKKKTNTKINKLDIRVIVASEKHDEGIKDVMTKTWLATYPNEKYGVSRQDILDFWEERKQKKRKPPKQSAEIKKWVALAEDRVVGYCILSKHKRFNEIGAIYILPKYQSKGIGGRFFEKALKHLGEEKEIRVIVVAYNTKAIQFYKKHGFKEDGRFAKRRYKLLGDKYMPLIELVKRFKR